MTDDRTQPKPLTDRIKERIGELVEELFETVAGALEPPARPVPIPVRERNRRPYR